MFHNALYALAFTGANPAAVTLQGSVGAVVWHAHCPVAPRVSQAVPDSCSREPLIRQHLKARLFRRRKERRSANPHSPKKSLPLKIARVASFPASETTLSLTFPLWIKNSPSVVSP
jgi:hypothetical protein